MKTSSDKNSKLMIKLFVFLGPLGNLISIPGINSFRLFYIIAIVSIPVLLLSSSTKEHKNEIIANFLYTIPFFAYSLITIFWADPPIDESVSELANNPLIRILVLYALYLFSLLASYFILKKFSQEEMIGLIRLYLRGYFISLFIGYLFQVSYSIGFLSLETIGRFQVIADTAYGDILRFAPGSYANEYANVSVFVASLLIFILLNREIFTSLYQNKFNTEKDETEKNFYVFLNKREIEVFLVFVLIAGFLTFTRTVYLTFLICLLYSLFKNKNVESWIKNSIYTTLFLLIFGIVGTAFIDMGEIFSTGLDQIISGEGSAGERYEIWSHYYVEFLKNPIWGIGYGTTSFYLHSNYFQIFFETGIVGTLLCMLAIFPTLEEIFLIFKRKIIFDSPVIIFAKFCLISVLVFGSSNHSLNHHLTWLAIVFTKKANHLGKVNSRQFKSEVKNLTKTVTRANSNLKCNACSKLVAKENLEIKL